MRRVVVGTILAACTGWLAMGQPAQAPPKFEIADVHPSAKAPNPVFRGASVSGGRYEVKNATMVDLIRTAYGFDAGKILGGPSWLEMDRFDVLAKLPAGSDSEAQKAMLQALLEDRFKLVVHKETKPVPALALTVGKKPQLKEAAGSEPTGCKVSTDAPPAAESSGTMRIMTSGADGKTTTFALGPGGVIQYLCRNLTMAAFAEGLPGMFGTSLSSRRVVDETGLKGSWNFDLRYSIGGMPIMAGASSGDRISLFDAVDKQLGLKLEEKPIPTPVMVVDKVDRTPTANPPGLAEALPPTPAPTEFEVASVKPAGADFRSFRFQMQPGGRFTAEGMTPSFLVNRAFNTNNSEAIVGVPGFGQSDRYDIIAKAPPGVGQGDYDALAPLIRSLLVDRFKMKYHTEERPVTAYSLVAVKPKMKKADPDSRTYCKRSNGVPPAPAGSGVLTCQNVTMEQFAERLQNLTAGLNWPVQNATELEGGWDFTLTFSMSAMMAMYRPTGAGGGEPGQAAGAVPAATEPVAGLTIFEALEKQLGLKLEKQKRNEPVIVIDHLEKPTEN